ncbi:hypothetical protein [Flavobacterium sp. SLB02]|jgi:hypothetical protein|nr:hypothetical protein [Flavobacterium sp. SLB02]QGK76417.1 hypothetical protein GIY83_20785 [Flavobacterium sp. SLB02]
MKKAFLGMLVIALGFGTMSLSTSSNDVANSSIKDQQGVQVVNVVFSTTYTAPWLGICCESPLSAAERDLIKRGLPPTNYIILSTTSNTVTYKVN